jgi:hypothetical protein
MIAARDGFNNPVDWFFVLKLPQQTFPSEQIDSILRKNGQGAAWNLNKSRDHCKCPDPVCPTAAAGSRAGKGRGSGLCYLYADSYNSSLRFYTDVVNPLAPDSGATLGCLGQGGNDPVSNTLTQLYANRRAADVEHAFWNDQYEGLQDSNNETLCAYNAHSNESLPYKTCPSTSSTACGKRCAHFASGYKKCSSDSDCASGDQCKQIECKERASPHWLSGCGGPFAHSKGALAFRKDGTGFFLQGTSPNFPDPSLSDAAGAASPALGCQLFDNVQNSQSFFGTTLSAGGDSAPAGGALGALGARAAKNMFLDVLAPALSAARLCSHGTSSCRSTGAGHLANWSCTSNQTRGQPWSILDEAFNGSSTANRTSAVARLTTAGVTLPLPQAGRPARERVAWPRAGSSGRTGLGSVDVTLVVKAEADHIPPWLLVASALESDLAVASWLDFEYGSPTICLGDDYSKATNEMCYAGFANVSLRSDGGAQYSVENALAASFEMGGQSRGWGLWGDLQLPFVSHAKFGLSSPPSAAPRAAARLGARARGGGSAGKAWVVSGDMNQQGWPCSKACNGSQFGRGGSFFALDNEQLHSSLAAALQLACACDSSSMGPERRFCGYGCSAHDTSAWLKTPPLTEQTASGWDAIAWTGNATR